MLVVAAAAAAAVADAFDAFAGAVAVAAAEAEYVAVELAVAGLAVGLFFVGSSTAVAVVGSTFLSQNYFPPLLRSS